jgi:hypothetical protein
MPNPSHDLRTKAHHFDNYDASKIEMMVRLNKLQNHFLYVCKQANWQIEADV